MRDVIIVGAGIVGSTIAEALRAQGMDVLLLDSKEQFSGTPPSGGHLKPSWFGDMPKKDYEPAMALLDEVWGLYETDFAVTALGKNLKSATVWRVDTDQVVQTSKTFGKVTSIKYQGSPSVDYETLKGAIKTQDARWLVVAAGVWCAELLPDFFPPGSLQKKKGVSFRFQGHLDRPFIKPWAPYKQVVAHQQSRDRIWVGDGSAILERNWDDKRTRKCLGRCRSALGTTDKPKEVLHGLRPYMKTGRYPCFFGQISPRSFVVTGAGKSGTIAAGWAAGRIIDAVC